MARSSERLYREAATILKLMDERKGSVRSLIFSKQLKIQNKAVYPLVQKTLSRKQEVLEIIEKSGILKKVPKLTVHQALVLVYDEVYGDGLRIRGPLTRAIVKHRTEIRKSIGPTKPVELPAAQAAPLLRYGRVNLLKGDLTCVLTKLISEGFTQMDSIMANALPDPNKVFALDGIVPNLLVFPSSVQLNTMELYLTSQLIIQDKASCLPAHLLQPPPGSTVIDACAAPGNKTSHLAAIMNNTGCVYAVDKDFQRFKAMQDYLGKIGATCVKCIHKDFFKVTPSDCADVEYVLVDPSCSGSGITSRMDYEELDTAAQEKRANKLGRFQASLLKHALSFPSVKRLVYSTCSIHKEENECVVRDALKCCSQFELEHAMPQWDYRGLDVDDFPEAQRCVRVWPKIHQAHGFFVAVFVRSQELKPSNPE